MRKVLTLVLLLLTAPPLVADSSRLLTRDDKQKAAEQAADMVMHRFYDTLDFSTIYDEMYVSDPLKTQEVDIIVGNLLRQGLSLNKRSDSRIFSEIEFVARERFYIALQNFAFLVSAMNFTYDGPKEKLDNVLQAEIKKHYMPIVDPKYRLIRSSDELDSKLTANFEQMNRALRDYVVARNFNSDLYRKRQASFQESRGPEALADLFGVRQRIYVAQRERLHLYFVEENGAFKMLSVTNRVQD